jgi:hypothetical protein
MVSRFGRGSKAIALSGIFLLAFILRLLPVFVFPGAAYPDEIFQSLEQAHRVVFGYGLVPWEFSQDWGARSWLLPGGLAGIMAVCRGLGGGGPECYLPANGIVLALIAAGAVLCCAQWGYRFFGVGGAIVAGMLPATWMDGVYFGPRTLSEVVAAHILIIGFYVIEPGWQDRLPSRCRVAAGAFLLGLSVTMRIQLMPAAIVMAWPRARGARYRLPPLLAGAGCALAFGGALDAFTWGHPFRSTWQNFSANILRGAAGAHGMTPWYQYGSFIIDYWGAAGAVILPFLAVLGARRMPRPLIAALVVIASHSLIGHKEYRFIYPAVLLMVASAGLGLAQAVAWVREGMRPTSGATSGPVTVGALIPALVAMAQWSTVPYVDLWQRGRGELHGSDLIARLPSVCGIGIYGMSWSDTGGYSHFHHRVPQFWPEDGAGFADYRPAFNVLLYAKPPPDRADFVDVQCVPGACVAIRPGGCVPMPMEAYPVAAGIT